MTIADKPPPKVAAPNYTKVLAAFGRELFGDHWPSGVARLAGVNPRTMLRVSTAANEGRDYPAARGVLAALHEKLAPIVAELRPWSRHAGGE